MVDSIVDSLVSLAIENLAKVVEDEVVLLVGVTKEIKKLSSTFTSIQVVLKDAETRRLKDNGVKNWLERLKDVAYDVDDILDEWMTETLKSQAPDEDSGSCFSKKKVRSFLSSVNCFNHVVLRHKIGSRIKEVRGRLDDIEKDKNQFNFITRGVDSEVREGEIGDRETSSLPEPFIVGREDVKKKVIDLLLGGSSREVNEVPFVISIVGMGGLGKTTLAQLIYNDKIVEGHFDTRMWVCVSEDFDVKCITKSIIKSADGSNCDHLDLDPLQHLLRGMLQAKRFLLVLDDVWSHDSEKWDRLRLPFQAGATGSRIIVTTRLKDVASTMGSTHTQELDVLSDDDCWSVFSRTALVHRSPKERSDLEEIGRQIVNRCGGVPLAAKTIGSAMHKRKTISQWELVLRSEVWKSGDVLGGILPALLLSYHDLPPALKQCFTYLSIFPKDRWIEKDTIVKLWGAQGFICSEGSEDMEEIGGLYFDDLLRRSLLQDAELDDDGYIRGCKMHDLVHDLAQSVAGSDCSLVQIGKQASLNFDNVRHSNLFASDEAVDEADEVAYISATLYKAHKLRTLFLESGISMVPRMSFHHWRRLRALDLSDTSIKKLSPTVGHLKHLRFLDLSSTDIEVLPDGLSNCINLQTLILYWCRKLKKLPGGMKKMINLRFLDLSSTGVEELPEEVCNCLNLQTLRLNWCQKLKKLPGGMKKMINLRHLELEGTRMLEYLPQGIGGVTGLQTLTTFFVGGGNEGCKSYGELKDLNHLQGSLRITGLDENRSRDEAREAELNKKQHLHTLSFEYNKNEAGNLLDEEVKRMEDVLEFLRPHTNLKEFEIRCYRGSKLPKWIEDPVFSNLVKVELSFCEECKLLPGFGKLPSLKYLNIEGMEQVRKVGVEFSGVDNNDGSGCVVSFPKLETLVFSYMPNWEEWELRGGVGEVMPSLLQLEVTGCPNLKELPSNLPPLLQKLTLKISKEGMLSSGGTLPVLPSLKHLIIASSDEVTSFPCGWLGQFKALETLEISGCPELKELPNLPTLLQKLTFQISNERMLSSGGTLPVLPNLKHFIIQGSVFNLGPKSFPCGWLGQFKALKTLEIQYCQELESLPDEELQQLTMLQELIINYCPLLKERYGDGGEDRDKIAHIPKITFWP